MTATASTRSSWRPKARASAFTTSPSNRARFPKARRPGEHPFRGDRGDRRPLGAVLIDLYLAISEPWVAKGVTALLVMQWDASNALGAAAYSGGWATAALGTLMHFCVSIVWGVLFVAAALR